MSSNIKIDNQTSSKWTRLGSKDKLSWGAFDGKMQPPMDIKANDSAQVKATGKGITGSEYTVYYSNGEGEIKLYCDNPSYSSNTVTVKCIKGEDKYAAFCEGSTGGVDLSLTVVIRDK